MRKILLAFLLAASNLLLVNHTLAQISDASAWKLKPSERTSDSLRAGGKSYIETIEFVRPSAAKTAEQLESINPNLPRVLSGFRKLMESAEVSERYEELYDRKIARLKKGELSTSHNYFDCETALRLVYPDTGRKVFLLQSYMDVVTDGSDPGRASKIEDYDLARTSDWYLPETSYTWARESGSAENPFLHYYPSALENLEMMRTQIVEQSKADPGVVWREMLKTCDAQISRIKQRGLTSSTKQGLNARRFLLADRDPFIVLPRTWVNSSSSAWGPMIGDFAAVVFKDRIYPAVLGDAGPADKAGEASLFIAKTLNPKANGTTRAISDVSVTYMVFPKSGIAKGEPNLKIWREHVIALLEEIGGVSHPSVIHAWPED
ncbi:MAG: glycoside hydrolase family 75 protein [Verrucomicrobia bacterium]|nr:glycoside hydrolase family 75 protein [Verrucomicrobiota bacterium]